MGDGMDVERWKHANEQCSSELSTLRKPRLFYLEEYCNTWVPAPDRVEDIIDAAESLGNGETFKITFKRLNMTDAEFDSLPEV